MKTKDKDEWITWALRGLFAFLLWTAWNHERELVRLQTIVDKIGAWIR